MKVIAHTGPLAYAYDGERYHLLTGYKPFESGSTYVITASSTNPLLVWTLYWELVDCTMRRRIGAALEKQGRSPYTGEPVPSARFVEGREPGEV